MIKTYILTAWRNIAKNKLYSFINIFGLTIGLVCAILIMLYVQNETSYDKHYSNHERIYRVESDFTITNKHDRFAIAAFPVAPTLIDEYPQIEQYTRVNEVGEVLVRYEEKEYYEDRIFFADSTYFDVFGHNFIKGDPETALDEKFSTVLTESLAKKYFGNENPIGKVMVTGSGRKYKVTGVIEDLKPSTHLKFDGLISMITMSEFVGDQQYRSREPNNFWNIGTFTYILLKENANIESLQSNLEPFYEKYTKPLGDQINASFEMEFSPLAEIHLNSDLDGDEPLGNKAYIYIFSAVALFMLILACINYMNLATARAERRSREVGIRKVSGAYKTQLIWQFVSESLLLAILALILAIFAVYFLLPVFNDLADKAFSITDILDPTIIAGLVISIVFVGLLSGSYPAFYLSSFNPIKVLKGVNVSGKNSAIFRKVLVVFQFFVAAFMIIATAVVSSQLNYFKNKDLGFHKENILILQMRDSVLRNQYESFKAELTQNPRIEGVATSSSVPGEMGGIVVHRVEQEGQLKEHAFYFSLVDYDYLDMMGFKLEKGRMYNKEMKTDETQAFIINQTLANDMGWGEDALGKRIQFGIDLDGTANRDGKVIGVLKDFHYTSLHNPVIPRIIHIATDPMPNVYIKLSGDNVNSTIDFIKETYTKFDHKNPFDYIFLEDKINEQYRTEQKMASIFKYFALLTLLIACLGLFGLSSYIASQRTKELGIRKVMGASIPNLIYILTKDFVILVFISNILAIVLSFLAMKEWLKNFAYATQISWIYFAASVLITIAIAMLITSSKALSAASTNPVNTLKYE